MHGYARVYTCAGVRTRVYACVSAACVLVCTESVDTCALVLRVRS